MVLLLLLLCRLFPLVILVILVLLVLLAVSGAAHGCGAEAAKGGGASVAPIASLMLVEWSIEGISEKSGSLIS